MVTPVPTPESKRTTPVGPTLVEWAAMSSTARETFLLSVIDALSDPRDLMTEGRPHKKAKTRALDLLGLHFKAIGRDIYLAEEMAVVYPGAASFSPDLLAVVGVPEPEDDQRLAWVVADEGRGLDFVLEVLHRGDRKKDLVENVVRYAALAIPEYFVYDRAKQQIVGYRLDTSGRYERIVPQAGRYTSIVLGLDLAVQGGTLRFFHGMAELFGSAELIARLTGMIEDIEAKAESAEAKAESAEAKAESAEAKAESAEAKAEDALIALRSALLAIGEARGLSWSDEDRRIVAGCSEPRVLQKWLLRAPTATTWAAILAD